MTTLAWLSALSLFCAEGGVAAVVPAGAAATATPAAERPAVEKEAAKEAPGAAADAVRDETAPNEPEAALAFGGESDEAVVQRVFAYLDRVTTLTGDFTQVSPSGAMSTGKFYLRRPGLLRFEYDAPSPILIVANGGMVYVRDDALETTDSYPVGKTPLKFLLRKKVDLGDAKIVAVDRGVDSVAITFSSSDDETEGDLSVILDAPALALREWIVRDSQRGVTIVTLDNVQQGITLANRLFETPEAESPFLKN